MKQIVQAGVASRTQGQGRPRDSHDRRQSLTHFWDLLSIIIISCINWIYVESLLWTPAFIWLLSMMLVNCNRKQKAWNSDSNSRHHCLVYSIVFLFQRLFSPIGTLLAKGKPPASQNSGTSSEVDALEPFRGILSGSSDRVSEAIGLTREGLRQIHWCCLDAGRSRKLPQQSNHTEPKSGRSWHRVTHTHTHTAHGASRESRFQRLFASIIADGAFNHKLTAQI